MRCPICRYTRPEDSYAVGTEGVQEQNIQEVEAGATWLCILPLPPTHFLYFFIFILSFIFYCIFLSCLLFIIQFLLFLYSLILVLFESRDSCVFFDHRTESRANFASTNTCRILIKSMGKQGGKGHQQVSALHVYTWRVSSQTSHILVVEYLPFGSTANF